MADFLVQLIIEIILLDIAFILEAKNRVVSLRAAKWLRFLFPKGIKQTTSHLLILVFNVIAVVVSIVARIIIVEADASKSYLQTLIDNASNELPKLLEQPNFWGMFILITICSVIAYYCRVVVQDEKENMTAAQLDEKYIKFSNPQTTNSNSTMFLIAGDLSFLGDIPPISDFATADREDCLKRLNGFNTSLCTKKHGSCPKACIEKSMQFAQLVKLKKDRHIELSIICRKPNPSDADDSNYVQVLGRLSKHFRDKLHIRFYTDEMNDNIVLRGRIKEFSPGDEMFWHWKNDAGNYDAPETWKSTTSSGKTLVFLLKKVLWENLDGRKATREEIDSYIRSFENTLK